MPPRALIIGGSLSGLFAATCLRAAGWDVDVFERSPHALDSRGGGLVLQPDVLDAFRFAGIPDAPSLGVRSDDRLYLDAHDRVLRRLPMPQTQSSWNLLHRVMRDTLPPERVHAGERLVHFHEARGRVTAEFASGRVAAGDLLVGADGARSTVRGQLLPHVLPHYAGYVAWRGLAPEAALSARATHVLGNAFTFQQGDGHLLLEYKVPGEDGSTAAGHRRWNWVWYRKVGRGAPIDTLLTDRAGVHHTHSLPPGFAKPADIDALRRDAGHLLAPSLRELLDITEAPFVQAISDLSVSRMWFGRTVLIGEAAFVPRPHTAGSTAQAAFQALSLARALVQDLAGHPVNLGRWETAQLERGAALTAWGRSLGERIMRLSR